jgi:2,4-dienoyl-CoA reductase-like NADH-dependent reductase (Old Yellow Enzyme family)
METKWENPIQKKEREEQKALERTQHEHYLKNKNMSKMMSKEDIKKMIKNYAKKN